MKAPFFNYAYWKFSDTANTLLPKRYSFLNDGMDDEETGATVFNTDPFVVDITGQAFFEVSGFHGWDYEVSIFENPYPEALDIQYGSSGTISNDPNDEYFTFGIKINPEVLVQEGVPSSRFQIPLKLKRKIEMYIPDSGIITERSLLHYFNLDWNPLENIQLQKQSAPLSLSIDDFIVKRNGVIVDVRNILFSENDIVELELVATGGSLSYTWFADGIEIVGETNNVYTYTMGIEDVVIKVIVTDGVDSGFRVANLRAIGRSNITDIFSTWNFSTTILADNKIDRLYPKIIRIREAFPSNLRTITYEWYKDGLLLTDTEKYLGLNTQVLLIYSATEDDVGDYYCRGINARGETFPQSASYSLEMRDSSSVGELLTLPVEASRRVLFDFNKDIDPILYPEITLQDLINDPSVDITDPIPNGRIWTPQSAPGYDELEYNTVIINKNVEINLSFAGFAFTLLPGTYAPIHNFTERGEMYDYDAGQFVSLNTNIENYILGDIEVIDSVIHMEFGYGVFYTQWKNIVDRFPIASPGAGSTTISHVYVLDGLFDTKFNCVVTFGYSDNIKKHYLDVKLTRRWL